MPAYKRDSPDDTEGKLFVGGIGWESDEEAVKEYFEKFGPVAYVKLKRNREDPSKHRGFAFVKFVNAEDADVVLNQEEPHLIHGSKIDPKSACPMGVKPEERTKKIFVGGLQAETTEEKLKEYFGTFGEIRSDIEFAIDRNTKKKRGFCFIEFSNEAIVDRIVKNKFHEVAGKRLETKRALSKQQQAEAAAAAGQPNVRAAQYGTPMVQQAGVTPYGQPVIYIHPDSLSTAYPMSALGMQGLTGGYASALETLYMPYNGSNQNTNRFGGSSRGGGGGQRHDPYTVGTRKY